MKFFIFLLLFCFLAGCSQKKSEELVGSALPEGGITKELPVLSALYDKKALVLSSEYQKHLDSFLENSLVKADELKLLQNKESYLPLQKMVENSKKYFYINILSFTCDDTTEKLVSLLETKSKQGVDVRLIVNKAFSYLSLSCMKRLESSGVQIVKAKTHSSYFLNDQSELMIGSQSVARMFFLADGFNSLDRDMMLYARGSLATDSLKDFLSIWAEENPDYSKLDHAKDMKTYQRLLESEYVAKKRGDELYKKPFIEAQMACRFVSEKPGLGVKDVQELWGELVKINQNELYFSGVKVETADGDLGKFIKEKARLGVKTHYLGNGYLGGNGELTMVLEEWMGSLKQGSFSFLVPAVKALNEWDKKRLARVSKNLYDSLQEKNPIDVWTYFNFIHYKVWSFDSPGFFIGSANLDESKFGVVYEAGVYCLDAKVATDLRSQLLRDQRNSTLYQGKTQVRR